MEEVNGDECIVETAIETIDVTHHAGKAMNYLKMVAKELLCPAANLVNGAVVFEDLLHSAAVTHPVKFGSPKEFAVLADTPTAASGFTNKGVKMAFAFGTFTRTKTDRAEASAAHGNIEMANASCTKSVESTEGSRGVVRLH